MARGYMPRVNGKPISQRVEWEVQAVLGSIYHEFPYDGAWGVPIAFLSPSLQGMLQDRGWLVFDAGRDMAYPTEKLLASIERSADKGLRVIR